LRLNSWGAKYGIGLITILLIDGHCYPQIRRSDKKAHAPPLFSCRKLSSIGDSSSVYVSNGVNQCGLISTLTFLAALKPLTKLLQRVAPSPGYAFYSSSGIVSKWCTCLADLTKGGSDAQQAIGIMADLRGKYLVHSHDDSNATGSNLGSIPMFADQVANTYAVFVTRASGSYINADLFLKVIMTASTDDQKLFHEHWRVKPTEHHRCSAGAAKCAGEIHSCTRTHAEF